MFSKFNKNKRKEKKLLYLVYCQLVFYMIVGSVFAVTTPNCHGKRQSCKFHGSIKRCLVWSFPSWQLRPTQMKCTCNANDSTYITLFLSELNTVGVIVKCYALFSLKHVWLVGIKSLLSVPNPDCLAFSDPMQVLKRIV